jgi:hypothetical protein
LLAMLDADRLSSFRPSCEGERLPRTFEGRSPYRLKRPEYLPSVITLW